MTKKIRDRLTGWRLWALFACGAVFLASGALLVRDLAQSAEEDSANQLLVGVDPGPMKRHPLEA